MTPEMMEQPSSETPGPGASGLPNPPDTLPPEAASAAPDRGLWETLVLGALGGVREDERKGFTAAIRRALNRPILPHQARRLRLSSAILTLLVLEVVFGIYMMLHYVPAIDGAPESVRYIDQTLTFGWFARSFHLWNGRVLAFMLGLGLVRMILAADYKDRGRSKWLAAVAMLLTAMVFQATGVALVHTEQGVIATEKLANALGDFPLIGGALRAFLVEPTSEPQRPLTRAFVAHVAVLPWFLFALVIVVHSTRTRVLKLRLQVDGKPEALAQPLWPDRILQAAALALVVVGATAALAVTFPPELGAPGAAVDRAKVAVDPVLRIFTNAAGIAAESSTSVFTGRSAALTVLLLVAGLFIVLPFFDRGTERRPKHRVRIVLASLFLFAILLLAAIYRGASS